MLRIDERGAAVSAAPTGPRNGTANSNAHDRTPPRGHRKDGGSKGNGRCRKRAAAKAKAPVAEGAASWPLQRSGDRATQHSPFKGGAWGYFMLFL
jgi:hypothetical protein